MSHWSEFVCPKRPFLSPLLLAHSSSSSGYMSLPQNTSSETLSLGNTPCHALHFLVASTAAYSSKGFLGGSDSKEFTRYSGDLGLILGWEDPLEEGVATHCSFLDWEISRTKEPGSL